MKSYYVGVSSELAKPSTLLELLVALRHAADEKQPHEQLGHICICCSSRDSLDTVVSSLRSHKDAFDLNVMHSDMGAKERDVVLASFRQSQSRHSQPRVPAGELQGPGLRGNASYDSSYGTRDQGAVASPVLVATDAALPDCSMSKLEAGRVPLLINFDLCTKKETLQKRVAAAFGSEARNKRSMGPSGTAAVHFVVAGQVSCFRSLERVYLPALIHEMPVHVADLLQQSCDR